MPTPPAALAGTPDMVSYRASQASRGAEEEAFDSAEVSGLLNTDPVYSLGLRLLGRHTHQLEFLSVDEARHATGTAPLSQSLPRCGR